MPENSLVIRKADWPGDKEALSLIRKTVFIEEQKVPEELEWDEYDFSSRHFLATLDNRPIASARLKADGQIGRMAVLKEYRNRGIGTELLRFVLQTAAEEKIDSLYLHAQVEAIPFYERQGFVVQGDVFYEADIPHRAMSKKTC